MPKKTTSNCSFLLIFLMATLIFTATGCEKRILCSKIIRNQEIRHTQRNAYFSIEEEAQVTYEKENTWKPDDFEKYTASFQCILKNTDNQNAYYKIVFEYQVASEESTFKTETLSKEIKSGETSVFIKSVSGLKEGSIQDFSPLVESTKLSVPDTILGLAQLYYKKCHNCNCDPEKDAITGTTENIEFSDKNQLDAIINQKRINDGQ